MRLSEIEEALTLGKCTPALMEQFRTALRRAPADMRPQHCFTTAAAMPQWCFPMAKELIEYSLEMDGTWTDRMRAHATLADLYEKQGDYQNALCQFQLALDAMPAERKPDYAPDSAARMLVCQLHLDSFTYSEELRRLYAEAQKLDHFSRSFQKCRFYLSLTQILLSIHDGDLPSARTAYEQASAMLRPGAEGPITALLKRKNYIESTGATKEALSFLKQIKAQQAPRLLRHRRHPGGRADHLRLTPPTPEYQKDL